MFIWEETFLSHETELNPTVDRMCAEDFKGQMKEREKEKGRKGRKGRKETKYVGLCFINIECIMNI